MRGESTTASAGATRVSANMGAAETFREFLDWAARYHVPEPGRQFFLVLWGHAYGLGFGRDHGDPLSLKEIRKELGFFMQARGDHEKTRGDKPLESLGANACAMSYAEAAFQLLGGADYLVASQVAVPFAGWPYYVILGRMSGAMSAEQVGQLVVDRYVTHFGGASSNDHVAMSLLRLGAGAPLKPLVEI